MGVLAPPSASSSTLPTFLVLRQSSSGSDKRWLLSFCVRHPSSAKRDARWTFLLLLCSSLDYQSSWIDREPQNSVCVIFLDLGHADFVMASKITLVFLLVLWANSGRCLELKAKAYEDLTVSISDNVPSQYCKTILANLEVSVKLLCKHFWRETAFLYIGRYLKTLNGNGKMVCLWSGFWKGRKLQKNSIFHFFSIYLGAITGNQTAHYSWHVKYVQIRLYVECV